MPNFTANLDSLMKDCFSIVVPVYNRASIVCKTLDSIARQSYRPLHLIIVDNNSTDDTLSVISQWKQQNESTDLRVTITTETSPGATSARNKGLRLVETEHMAFFDSDDEMRSNAIEEYVNAFAESPEADIVCSNSLYHFADGRTRLMRYRRGDLLHNHIYHATLRTQGYAVKTEFIRSVGGWDPQIMVWNDWELGIRMLLNAPVVKAIDKTLVDIYMQTESITGLGFSDKAGQWEISLDKADQVIDHSLRNDADTLHRLIHYRRIILAAHYLKEGNSDLAHQLYDKVMSATRRDARMHLLMPLVYLYTSMGGRGAATLIDRFL